MDLFVYTLFGKRRAPETPVKWGFRGSCGGPGLGAYPKLTLGVLYPELEKAFLAILRRTNLP